MSMLSGMRKYSRTLAKGSLYAGGAIALGYPLIKAGLEAMGGTPGETIMNNVMYNSTGYNVVENKIDGIQTGVVIMRDLVGIGAIFAASKL